MENEFVIPNNIPVIDKAEDYVNIPGIKIVEKPITKQEQRPTKPGIKTTERIMENGFVIPDNIQIVENMEDLEVPPTDLNEPIEEPFDIWKQVDEEFDSSEYLTEDSAGNVMIDKEKLLTWLKQKLSSVSFCETYLTTKLDGNNGVVQENSTLMLHNDNGSKFFLNKNGNYHRLDGPAIEWYYGANEFFKNGIRHRIDGPAYEYEDEKQFWFEGKQYNENEYWLISKEIQNLK